MKKSGNLRIGRRIHGVAFSRLGMVALVGVAGTSLFGVTTYLVGSGGDSAGRTTAAEAKPNPALWMPGAKRINAHEDGGSMIGGPSRVIWHTTENDPTKTSATTIANFLNSTNNQVHLVWNPTTGEIVQMIPANRAGRGVRNNAGGVQTNREGARNIQIEVVGRAAHPFTQNPTRNRAQIIAWLRSLGIPSRWPQGAPTARVNPASAKTWTTQGGYYGHSQVPENTDGHTDPGPIDIRKLFGIAK